MRSPAAGIRIVAGAVVLLVHAAGSVAAQERLAIMPVTVVDVTDG